MSDHGAGRVDAVELRVVRVPLRTPFANAAHVTTHKETVLVVVEADGVRGVGEGVMEPLPWFREETLAGALHVLRAALVPDLLHHGCHDVRALSDRWSFVRGNPMAKAALEMAVWDAVARRRGEPLWQLLGGDGQAVEVGAALGIEPDTARLVDTVGAHLDQGYRRIKLKIAPGRDVVPLTAVRAAHPDAALSVDGNSAYTLSDAAVLSELDRLSLDYLEQPLHWDDLVDHAVLAAQIHTPLCLDESLSSPQRVAAALDLRACAVVNVKAGRLGGHQAVRRVAELCAAAGVAMWCGGMLELGVGRAHNIHLATLPGFTLPGDTASASRTYARDVIAEPLEAVHGLMPVPSGPGIGVTLDQGALDAFTVSVERHARRP